MTKRVVNSEIKMTDVLVCVFFFGHRTLLKISNLVYESIPLITKIINHPSGNTWLLAVKVKRSIYNDELSVKNGKHFVPTERTCT